ncbi:MAG: DUF47 domain-containing protein [Negativicutes bacterium]
MIFSFLESEDAIDYLRTFTNLSTFSLQAAEFLDMALKNVRLENMPEYIVKMHEIEHNADLAKHDMIERLIREFLPPIDKDDIIILSHKIDTVTDVIEEVLILIDVHQITQIPKDVHSFTELIIGSCRHMNLALKEMENFKESSLLYDQLKEVHRLKAAATELYVNSLKNFYDISNDPVQRMIYSELYKRLKRPCIKCKKVTNTIERIVIKNL